MSTTYIININMKAFVFQLNFVDLQTSMCLHLLYMSTRRHLYVNKTTQHSNIFVLTSITYVVEIISSQQFKIVTITNQNSIEISDNSTKSEKLIREISILNHLIISVPKNSEYLSPLLQRQGLMCALGVGPPMENFQLQALMTFYVTTRPSRV